MGAPESVEVAATPAIGIVVVAYNAASTLVSTLNRIPRDFARELSEIIILDDASSDQTHTVAQAWAERAPAAKTVVIRHTKNLGYGGNQKAAYQVAADHGLDIVVLLHGDGQYAPELMPRMVAPLLSGEADAVFGSRMIARGAAKAGGMPLYKRLGNRILTMAENLLLGTQLSEFHSGYRAYSVRALAEIPFKSNSDGFDFDTQIIVQLLHAGKRIVELPIPTYYGDEICYVNGIGYAWEVLRDVVEYRLAKKGFGTPEWVPASPEYGFKEGDGSSHSIIIDMLQGVGLSRILDLGCSGGLLGERLRGAGHYVVGADSVEVAGVGDRLDEFHLVDLRDRLPAQLGGDFDVVILADVVEHLPDSLTILQRAAALVRPGGQILLSVPNVGHWYPRVRMALGRFGYDRRGILDVTHLRFFTRRSIRQLVSKAGLDVLEWRSTGLPLGAVAERSDAKVSVLGRIDAALVRLRPQLFAYQFVVRATPHVESSIVSIYGAAEPSLESWNGRPLPQAAS